MPGSPKTGSEETSAHRERIRSCDDELLPVGALLSKFADRVKSVARKLDRRGRDHDFHLCG
jgi:hypothetical protein